MNKEGKTSFRLLGVNYDAHFTWGVYERVRAATGQCPYAVFSDVVQQSSDLISNDLFSTAEGISISCNELAQTISLHFAYHLLYEMAHQANKAVTQEEIQDALLQEGTAPSTITIEKDGREIEIECDGYCFIVSTLAMWALDIGGSKKKAKNPSFVHLLMSWLKKAK